MNLTNMTPKCEMKMNDTKGYAKMDRKNPGGFNHKQRTLAA